MSWTTPAELRAQLQKRWDSGQILAATLTGEALFPLPLRLRRPGSRELAEDFAAVGHWARTLRASSREQRGHGYEIRWERVNHRVHGANDLPAGVAVPSEADALQWLGKTREAQNFHALAEETLARFPALRDWLIRHPLTPLEQAGDWPRILAVLAWFQAHPRPGIYLRQMDLPGVDTKFVESRRKLLSELLDAVLPPDAVDARHSGGRGFELRYGLTPKPPLIRFRMLDPALSLHGLSDLSVPPTQFATLAPAVARVFITENEINGLAFPDTPGSLVIFGLGYGLERLADIPWLRQVEIHYWGDIDTHGFAILDRLRARLPQTRSLLMDRATLAAHRDLWGQEHPQQRFTGTLTRLTPPEQSLFEDLRENRLGECIRLEQERIGYGELLKVISTPSQVLQPQRQPIVGAREPSFKEV
ncbi:DUF3322 domain-containing protein [Ectothiorhodospira lacustris]|uniref:DUF3322 domain-containing protein n=1 Tax=Ectothiorhodospira lacustris TaxID=2899127 RepID=UPI001EE80400|nr:DUF3322 domain-containing protein [Ectothiorhodospira lacustris]MCG5501767.1 DUF3322 domain-containing protein [Ectothiorhodospira lacustris]